MFGETKGPKDMTYGLGVMAMGLINLNLKLPMIGTYIGQKSSMNDREVTAKLISVNYPIDTHSPGGWRAGSLSVELLGPEREFDHMVPGMFLKNTDTGEVVALDYVNGLKVSKNGRQLTLKLPPGRIPKNFEAFVMADLTVVGRFTFSR